MKLLAFDTCTDACTVGLRVDSDDRLRHRIEPKAHTRLLIPMIESLLDEAGLETADLDAIVLGNGPGSFIGLRIGVSVAQGLAYAAARPVVAVSSLAAIAAAVFADTAHRRVAVVQDARMNQVYLAWFERGDDGFPLAVGPVSLHGAGEPVANGGSFALAGGAIARYPELADRRSGDVERLVDYAHPHAAQLLELGARDFRAGRSLRPENIEPAYVRTTVARPPARVP